MSGDPQVMVQIRECLDSGTEFPVSQDAEERQQFLHAIAESLIQFLEALPIAVVPAGVCYQRCLDAYQSPDLAKQVPPFMWVTYV